MKYLLLILLFPVVVLSQTTIDKIHGTDVNNLSKIHGTDIANLKVHGYDMDLESGVFSNDSYFAFDGVDAYMSYDTENNNREIEDDFTMAFWFRAHDGYTGNQFLSTRGAANFIKLPVIQYAHVRLNNEYDTLWYDVNLTNNTWYHIAYVRDLDDTLRQYINGVEQDSNYFNAQDYKFQYFGTNGAAYEEFDIDELILFDTNLAQAYIDTLAALGTGDPTDITDYSLMPNIMWWWRMGDDDSDTHTLMIDQQDSLNLDVTNAISADIKDY